MEIKRERAVIVGLNAASMERSERSTEESLAELEELLRTAGGECCAVVLQNMPEPNTRSFIGEGKVREVRELIAVQELDMAVFDNELTPSQTNALNDDLGVKVIDRSSLILDIFAQRARSREGKLQVELAQYKYLLPRLTGMWTHLVRQTASGGSSPIGTRGPGETQLESDRRHIHRKIQKLTEELTEVRRVRDTQRRRRTKNEIPIVALVGYTNAGKSTILNYLTGAGIPANDRLFDTLDTTTRRLQVSDTLEVLLSDTVGFIRKLPTHLVEAFKATLEELEYADLILNVIDASSLEWREQTEVVEALIVRLGAAETPRIDVYNKCDLCPEEILPRGETSVHISAKTGEGMDELKRRMAALLDNGSRRLSLLLPYSKAQLVNELYTLGKVLSTEYRDDGIAVEAVCPAKALGRFAEYRMQSE